MFTQCSWGRFFGAGLIGLAAVGCAGEPKQLPPRAPPAREIPPVSMPAEMPKTGYGRIVLHGTDGPMRVVVQADTSFIPPGGSVPPTRTGELCPSTPCAADLPVGRYKLFLTSADGSFTHGDTDELIVTEGVTYYVRSPGRYEAPHWIHAYPALLLAGAVALVVGGSILASEPGNTNQGIGIATMIGGAGLGVWGGIELYDESRAKQQNGATTVWKP